VQGQGGGGNGRGKGSGRKGKGSEAKGKAVEEEEKAVEKREKELKTRETAILIAEWENDLKGGDGCDQPSSGTNVQRSEFSNVNQRHEELMSD
jgi:hypothetical protein